MDEQESKLEGLKRQYTNVLVSLGSVKDLYAHRGNIKNLYREIARLEKEISNERPEPSSNS